MSSAKIADYILQQYQQRIRTYHIASIFLYIALVVGALFFVIVDIATLCCLIKHGLTAINHHYLTVITIINCSYLFAAPIFLMRAIINKANTEHKDNKISINTAGAGSLDISKMSQ